MIAIRSFNVECNNARKSYLGSGKAAIANKVPG